MTPAALILTFVTLQRLGELVYARANETRLRARGAIEIGAAHYPFIVGLHALWLASLWVLGRDRPVEIGWAALYLGLQAARVWVLATLGRRWSTRVLVVPGERLVRRGPYRLVAHPNYAVVAAEMFVLPLALGLPWLSLGFGVLDLIILGWRIQVESRGLAELGAT